MPWKDGYTISGEKSLLDDEVRWPEEHRCCFSITVDLSVAAGPDGITEADLSGPKAQFGVREGFDRIKDALDRFGLKATFATPAVMARVQAHALRVLTQQGHEIAAMAFTPRLGETGAEIGDYTFPAFRSRGFAAAATAKTSTPAAG